MNPTSYDPKVFILACDWLDADEQDHKRELTYEERRNRRHSLALRIQEAIEDWHADEQGGE